MFVFNTYGFYLCIKHEKQIGMGELRLSFRHITFEMPKGREEVRARDVNLFAIVTKKICKILLGLKSSKER